MQRLRASRTCLCGSEGVSSALFPGPTVAHCRPCTAGAHVVEPHPLTHGMRGTARFCCSFG
eukprot:1799110-Alexandrium_andersonii.AAC.1